MKRHQAKVFNLAFRFLNSKEEAEDLTQEIFLKVYRKIGGFRGDARFSTWIFQIAANHCRNRLKYLQRRGRGRHDSLDETRDEGDGVRQRQMPDLTKIPQDLVEREQIKQIVTTEISHLPEEYRTVIILRDIQGFSYEEIAKITGALEGTVKSRLHRARMELKDRLGFLK